MQQITVLLGLVALSAAQWQDYPQQPQYQQQQQYPQQPQYPQPPVYPNVPGVAPPPWQGPLADHVNGIPPRDTPEVAQAKLALNQAYSQVLAVLPELPSEERYRDESNYGATVQQYNQNLGGPVYPQQNYNNQPQQQQNKFYAEEVPRSILGEVPEVHAARVAHLKAFQEIAATLPRLVDTYSQQNNVQAYQQPAPQYNNYGQQYPQDTPEVARAKAEHAAALAALG